MLHRMVLGLVSLVLLPASGCCCPRACAPTACDPGREIGVDLRGLVAQAPREPQVFLDMTIARIPEARVDQALGADRPLNAGDPNAVTAARARALVAAWRRDPAVEITSAPKLLALPGQEASIFVGETVRFARTAVTETGATMDGEAIRYARTEAVTNQEGGLEFTIEEDPHGPIDLGMRIVVVSNPTADGSALSVELAGSWRELKRELTPEVTAQMTAVEFETHVREHRHDLQFDMPDDGWVLLGNPEWIETDAGRVLQVMLLHTVVIDASKATSGE